MMRLNENVQVPISVPGGMRAWLYDRMQEIARVVNRKGADTAEDLIVDTTTKGLVLKDSSGHYWRVSVNTSGTLLTTDLGTTKP